MHGDNSFHDLIRRLRAGDDQAAAELVRRYEPAIRMAVRVRLTNRALRHLFDSTDICQSVLANFFVRAAAGQFSLEQPAQALQLLVEMARNKLADQERKHRAARRDYRRVQEPKSGESAFRDPGPSPSEVVANRELLQKVRQRLSEEELQLVEKRAQGRSWAEIAADIGAHPNAVRMRLTRALDRVTHELGLD